MQKNLQNITRSPHFLKVVVNRQLRHYFQQVSYPLQRVEDFPGLINLASNNKRNLDSTFIRRCNSIIHFPMPTPTEWQKIWETTIPPKATLAKVLDLFYYTVKFEHNGSAITSVIHFASLLTIHKKQQYPNP